MSLADLIQAEQSTFKGGRCSVCLWLDDRTPEDLEAFEAALDAIDAGRLSRARLHRACQIEGMAAGKTTFQEHCTKCVVR